MSKFNLPATRLIILAAVAGMIAGGVAVYVRGGLSGNDGPEVADISGPDKACEARAEMAKAIAAKATGDVAALLPADPPQSLAALAFNGPDAKPMSLKDFTGRTVLLNLWATWCAPCRAEMPSLDALELEMGGESFEVVAVNIDTGDDTKPKKFLEETGVATLGYYRDATLGVFNDLKKRGLALGLPVTLLIGPDGCLLAHMNGPAEWAGEDARRLVEAALGSES
ncbi:MAG TPA: TlpA disulfide reductase family protein [Rhizobiaceae bacterium]|nr:TlpA disulfide reductase family protein [Rhizobiaceae bacterium]